MTDRNATYNRTVTYDFPDYPLTDIPFELLDLIVNGVNEIMPG
jgi:hypothetical protein